jgi:hypothetical protein
VPLYLFTAFLCIAAIPARAAVEGTALLGNTKIQVAPGKSGTVVLFLSDKCPCSNSHLARIKALVKDFPSFAFVAVHANSNEPTPEAAAYFKQADLDMPVIQDQESKLADQFKALKTPHAFVLAANGDILYRGGVTNSANGDTADKQLLREALEDVNAGHAVRTPTSRTLGCVIAR